MGFASGPHPGASYSKIEQRGDLNDSDIVETLARVKGAKSRRYCLHLSLAANTLLLALSCWLYIQSRPKDSRTLFAKLAWDYPVKWDFITKFGTNGLHDPVEQDRLWESYQVGQGNVALLNKEATSLGLPLSQPFAWDRDRGVYVLAGHHALHCVRKIRRYVVQSHRGQEPFDHFPHIVHCLEALRQDVLCYADDTPMHRSQVHGTADLTARGQTRMCRDWSKLERFARKNTACYALLNETQGVSSEIERYKYCPKDSIFAPNMREYFSFPADYVAEPDEQVPDYSP